MLRRLARERVLQRPWMHCNKMLNYTTRLSALNSCLYKQRIIDNGLVGCRHRLDDAVFGLGVPHGAGNVAFLLWGNVKAIISQAVSSAAHYCGCGWFSGPSATPSCSLFGAMPELTISQVVSVGLLPGLYPSGAY